MNADHLAIGYSLKSLGATKHRTILIDLRTLQGVGQGERDLAYLLRDVDQMLKDAEVMLTRCQTCHGAGQVWEYVGTEPVAAKCPECSMEETP